MTIKLTDGLYTVETVVLAQNNGGLKALYQLSSAIKMKEKRGSTFRMAKTLR